MPSHNGLPLLPDFEDMDSIERNLIPALESWVADADRGTDEWACRLTLLTVVANRLAGARRVDALHELVTRDYCDAQRSEVAKRVTFLEVELDGLRAMLERRFDALETAIIAATNDGVARIIGGQ